MSKTRGLRKDMNPVDEVMNDMVETDVQIGTVTASLLNVRKEPSMKSAILQVIRQNDKVEILEDKEELWYMIKIDGNVTGFCMKSFIEVQ